VRQNSDDLARKAVDCMRVFGDAELVFSLSEQNVSCIGSTLLCYSL
jgi:hypothetical protein